MTKDGEDGTEERAPSCDSDELNKIRNRIPAVYFLGGYHPSNESFIRCPPTGIRFHSRVRAEEFDDFAKLRQYSGMWPVVKKTSDLICRLAQMPRLLPIFGRYDLIHTNGSVIPVSSCPWVASIENPSAFFGFNERWHETPRMKKRLASFLTSDRCRSILPYSYASKHYLTESLGDWREAIEAKTEIIPLSINPRLVSKNVEELQPRDDNGKVKLLFVGNHFFDKGGREVLRAFESIRDHRDATLTVVASAPPYHAKLFKEYVARMNRAEDVRFYHTGIPRASLLDLYKESHVFVFPSYMDQVPFVLLEAMAAGLPLIGSNSFAMPEMAIDGVNGFVIESPWIAFRQSELRTVKHLSEYRSAVMDEGRFDGVVDGLVDRLRYLIDHEDTRLQFARQSLSMVTEGKFSIGRRNEALLAAYNRSLVAD